MQQPIKTAEQILNEGEPKVAPIRKSKLKAVDPKSATPSRPKVLIFGPPGVGKTWGALDFPVPYYIDTEGGADLAHYTDKLKKSGGVYYGPEQGSLSFENIIEQVKALATEDHPYKTLIIDSISSVFIGEIANEAERLHVAGKKDEYGASKKPAVSYTRRLTNWLKRVDMNVILIAHQKGEWGVDAKGERVEIGKTFDAHEKLEYDLHLALQILKTGDKRIARVRKSRLLGFPEASTFPWSYVDFANRYGQDIIEKSTEKLVLATPEQLAKIRELLAVVKLPEGLEDRWYTAANVTSFEEMDSDKLAAIIKLVKDKFLPPKENA